MRGATLFSKIEGSGLACTDYN